MNRQGTHFSTLDKEVQRQNTHLRPGSSQQCGCLGPQAQAASLWLWDGRLAHGLMCSVHHSHVPKGPQASTWRSPAGPSLLEESTPLVSFPGTPAPSAGFRAEEDKATQPHSGLVDRTPCFLTTLTSVIFTPVAAQQTWTPFLPRCELPKQRANLDQSKAQLSCGAAGPVCSFCRSSWSSQDSWPPEGSQTQPHSQSVFLTVWKLLALAGLFEKSTEVVRVHGRTTVASYLSQKVVQTFTILGNIVKQHRSSLGMV